MAPNDVTHFNLPSNHGAGKVFIVDLRRQRVRFFQFAAGQDVTWDGKDDNGNIVASEVYIYLLESDGSVKRGTVTVMR